MAMTEINKSVFLYGLLLAIVFSATSSEGAVSQWCVADPQAPDYFLQSALDWVCSSGGTDCSSIQPNQACYEPQNLVAHASVAFNSYWQKYKQQGASCYFNSAAFVTENNPSLFLNKIARGIAFTILLQVVLQARQLISTFQSTMPVFLEAYLM